jgi:hypothetical protein
MEWPLALTGVLLIVMFATLDHGRLAADIVLLGVLLALLVTAGQDTSGLAGAHRDWRTVGSSHTPATSDRPCMDVGTG